MRAFIIACALAALFGSYGADANLGESGARAAGDEQLLALNEPLTIIDDTAGAQAESDPAPRPRRRTRAVSSGATEGEAPSPGVGVHTRIQTCQGVAVTITSFGGGDWDQGVESFCEEPVSTSEEGE